MIIFWLICAVFIAIALAFVLPPLLQTSLPASPGSDDEQRQKEANVEANVDIYRDQISELEADVANGIISPEQCEHDRDEIERRLLEDVSGAEVPRQGREKRATAAVGRGPVYAVAIGIPLIAIGLYLRVGNPAAISHSAASPSSPASVRSSQAPFAGGSQPNGQMTQQAIETNVAALAKRLEQNPGDVQGWIMLGRSYVNLEKYSEASNAYAKATALKPDDADLLGDYAFALGMANGQRLQGQPFELINRALKLDPDNPKALELAGSAAFEAKNYSQAISYWQKLLEKTPPDSELAQALSEKITEAKSLAGAGAK